MSDNRAQRFDLAVVGGGVIGLSIAWRAQRRGLSVCVLERDRVGHGTSWHAAGMIAPVTEAAPAERPLLELGLRSAAAFPEWAAELARAAGVDGVGLETHGTLLVARDADEAESLERELALRERLGLPVTRLRPSAARRLEPALAPSLRLALEVPSDHAVDPRALVAALAAAVGRGGGEVREGAPVAAVDGAGVVLADGSRVDADRVVLAAGAWGERIAGVEPLPVRPVKGQIMRLRDPAGPGLLTRVVRVGSWYVVPRGDGRYVLGATSEERGFDTAVTAGAAFELLREGSELVPGISELALEEFTAGLRPATPDSLPAIGPAADVGGVLWATGHFRGGVLLAPATAELVAGMLCGDPVDPLAAAFDPARLGARVAA